MYFDTELFEYRFFYPKFPSQYRHKRGDDPDEFQLANLALRSAFLRLQCHQQLTETPKTSGFDCYTREAHSIPQGDNNLSRLLS